MAIDLKQIDNSILIENHFEKKKNDRAYYVMDRVAVSQLAFLQMMISLIVIFELLFVIIDYLYNILYRSPSMLMEASLLLFASWALLVIFFPPILAREKLSSSGTGEVAIEGGRPSQLTIDNTITIKLASSNQGWGRIVIPVDYTPYIRKIIEKKYQELKEKFELKLKENKEKHYLSHYSPYNSMVQYMNKIEQPMARLNEYKKNIAQKYGLKKI